LADGSGKPRWRKKNQGRIVETATEARQAEPGPSILLILIVSVVLAVAVLGALWFIFFRT
jgi:cobalamin biosynthesis Mg chelatase CobN